MYFVSVKLQYRVTNTLNTNTKKKKWDFVRRGRLFIAVGIVSWGQLSASSNKNASNKRSQNRGSNDLPIVFLKPRIYVPCHRKNGRFVCC